MGSDRMKLYDVRCRIGPERQPRHAARFAELCGELLKTGMAHPYALNSTAIATLMACPAFAQGGNGLTARPPASGHLYRMTGVMKLVRYTDWTAVPNQDNNDDEIWRELAADHLSRGDWLPLSSYARGHLRGFRGVTWWTTREDLVPNPVPVAHSLGIPNDWIPTYAVVLRCPVDGIHSIAKLTVPDILDGFVQEVFHPTRDSESPAAGVTIRLRPGDEPGEGADEYLAEPVPVEHVTMWPLQITPEMRADHPVWLGPALWEALYRYYSRL